MPPPHTDPGAVSSTCGSAYQVLTPLVAQKQGKAETDTMPKIFTHERRPLPARHVGAYAYT